MLIIFHLLIHTGEGQKNLREIGVDDQNYEYIYIPKGNMSFMEGKLYCEKQDLYLPVPDSEKRKKVLHKMTNNTRFVVLSSKWSSFFAQLAGLQRGLHMYSSEHSPG